MTAAPARVDRFDEAVEWFLGRKVVTAGELTSIISASANDAFWIGGGLQLDQIQRVFDKIAFALEDGIPFETWREQVLDELISDRHAETVFRNATQRAYNAGRWAQMQDPDVLKFRPFLVFDAVLDDGTTEICRVCNQTILPADDPFWESHVPPLHHRCRSSLRNLRTSEAERQGIDPEAPDTEELRAPGDWGGKPTEGDGWRPEPTDYDADLNAELEDKADNVVPIRGRRPEDEKKKPKAKPPKKPTGLPEPLSKEEAKRLLGTLEKDRGRSMREFTRETLRAYGLEVRAENKGITILPKRDMEGAAAFTIPHPQSKNWGILAMDRNGFQSLQKDLRDASAGKESTYYWISTMIHEEVHLTNLADSGSLRYGTNVFIEEVGTELLAERVLSDLKLVKPLTVELGRTSAKFSRPIAYQVAIEGAIRDVIKVTGYTPDQALDFIVETHKASRRKGNATDDDTYLSAFMRNANLDDQKKDELLLLLVRRKL